MKEYTLLSAVSVLLAVYLDKALKVNILATRRFYLYLVIILLFKFLVNGYLTGREVVIYNPKFFIGIRIGSIPVEDFLFGFSMVALTVIFWEYFKRGSE